MTLESLKRNTKLIKEEKENTYNYTLVIEISKPKRAKKRIILR